MPLIGLMALAEGPRLLCHQAGSPSQTFDAVARLGPHSGAILLIHQWGQESAFRVKALDDMGAYYRALGFNVLTVLSANAGEGNSLPDHKRPPNLRRPMVHAVDPGTLGRQVDPNAPEVLLLFRDHQLVQRIPLAPGTPTDPVQLRSWIEALTGPMPMNPQDYLESIEAHLPKDPHALREWVISQSLELHRIHREMKAATAGIPKYRSRKPIRMTPAPPRKR